jgi:hypothetical protein
VNPKFLGLLTLQPADFRRSYIVMHRLAVTCVLQRRLAPYLGRFVLKLFSDFGVNPLDGTNYLDTVLG